MKRHSSSSLLNPGLFLRHIPPLELFPPPRRLIIPPANRVGVHVCRYADRGVAQPFGKSRDLHPCRQEVGPVTMAQGVQTDSLRQFQAPVKRRHRCGNESGFNSVPSGFANIKSRSVR